MAARQRTGAEDAFMRWALLHILGRGQNHPLAFLIDWQRKEWHSRQGSRRRDALRNEHVAPVQPGHLQSFRSLADPAVSERLALEDADFNQEKELHGGIQGRLGGDHRGRRWRRAGGEGDRADVAAARRALASCGWTMAAASRLGASLSAHGPIVPAAQA
jgi:hypothetical protein